MIYTAMAIIGDDTKLDAKVLIPYTITDEMAGVDYDVQRMVSAIDNAIRVPVDALIVSIPDYERLREPIMRAKNNGIPVIAVYSGLAAAKEMGILAVMSDDVSLSERCFCSLDENTIDCLHLFSGS